MSQYTAISFAPVQGFIEKSRKLRDLFGASLILSYLSYSSVQVAKQHPNVIDIISPGGIDLQKGMPNRILIKGEFSRNDAANTLLDTWQTILEESRGWIEKKIPIKDNYEWELEWRRWGMYTWEIFWGQGDSPDSAMRDLERRKLRGDWTGINWTGDSSSLTGTDAIAWQKLGKVDSQPGRQLTPEEKQELQDFYTQLSRVLEDCPPDKQPEGKFLAANERLSIPELVKRLVTREDIGRKVDISPLEQGFTEIIRKTENGTGHWTGWFLGDGDKVGDKIKKIDETEGDDGVKKFSAVMRDWGTKFYQKYSDNSQQSSVNKVRVVYAGGDDFLGVIHSSNQSEAVPPIKAWEWLMQLPEEWRELQDKVKEIDKEIDFTFSVGFVWVAPSVPQRDVLQHCREAEQVAKKLGRNRVTIRVVFNSGQFVQWTCPWDELKILQAYRDRDKKGWGEQQNWSYIYNDLAHLKARHAIVDNVKEENMEIDMALALLNIYFPREGQSLADYLQENWKEIAGDSTYRELINWITGLINVGWYLCADTQ